MNIEMFSVGRLILCMLDIYMLYRFFHSMFATRGSRSLRWLCFIVITFLILGVNSFGVTLLNLLSVPFLYLAFVLFIFKLKTRNGIIFTIIFYAVFAGGREVAYELLFRLLSNVLPFSIPQWFTSIGFYYLLPEYLLSFLFLLFLEKFTKKMEIEKENEFAWYLVIMPISTLLILSSFLYMDSSNTLLIQKLMCGGAFLLYFSNAAIFIILARYTSLMNRLKYEEMYKMKQQIEEDYYQNIAKHNETYRNYIHETRKYFNNIRLLALNGNSEEIVNIINAIDGKIQEDIEGKVYSGNKVFNAILTECSAKAKNQGIEFTIFIEQFLKVDFIETADMISMFGNLLDNALEAAARCPIEERKVEVKFYMGNSYMLVMHVENHFTVSAPRTGDTFLTTKRKAECHGRGIGIVKKLANKYGGTLSVEENGNIFITSLVISACEKMPI